MKFDASLMQASAPQRSRMDVPREQKPKRGRYVVIGAGGALFIAVAALAMNLKPAAPSVDRGTLVIDSVRRGDMVREVRGPGTLVPEQIRWISAVTSARVERIWPNLMNVVPSSSKASRKCNGRP